MHPARGAGANVQIAAARHARRETVMPRASSTHGQPASLSTIRRQVVHTAHAWHGEPATVARERAVRRGDWARGRREVWAAARAPRLRVCGAGDEVSGDELYL